MTSAAPQSERSNEGDASAGQDSFRPPESQELAARYESIGFVTLADAPVSRVDLPANDTLVLEEYKLLVNEHQVVMYRYMQFLFVYPIVMGYSFNILLGATSLVSITAYGIFILTANLFFTYGAIYFRSMAYHVLNRETALADHLKMQRPHPMMWGYRGGIAAFRVSSAFAAALVFLRLLQVQGQLPL